MSKKILFVDFVSTSPAYAGYFSNALKKAGNKVDILGVVRDDFKEEIHSFNIKYKKLINIKINDSASILNKIAKIIMYYSNWILLLFIAKKYDVIHFQWIQGLKFSSIDLVLIKLLKKIHKNIYYTVHNIYPHDTKNIIIKKRYDKLYSLIDNLVVHSNSTKNKLTKILIGETKNIIVMPHGAMFQDYLITSVKKNNYIGILGRLCPYKGVEDAVEVLHLLNKDDKKYRLILAGKIDKGYKLQILDLIKKYHLESQVICKFRFIDDKEFLGLMKEIKILLCPYRKIEQSGASVAALTVGTPVVGYKVGALPDLIINGKNGYLVDKGDIKALAKSVSIINGMDNFLLEKNCKESILKFDWSVAADIMNANYKQ